MLLGGADRLSAGPAGPAVPGRRAGWVVVGLNRRPLSPEQRQKTFLTSRFAKPAGQGLGWCWSARVRVCQGYKIFSQDSPHDHLWRPSAEVWIGGESSGQDPGVLG